jgi:hypothetical protein
MDAGAQSVSSNFAPKHLILMNLICGCKSEKTECLDLDDCYALCSGDWSTSGVGIRDLWRVGYSVYMEGWGVGCREVQIWVYREDAWDRIHLHGWAGTLRRIIMNGRTINLPTGSAHPPCQADEGQPKTPTTPSDLSDRPCTR